MIVERHDEKQLIEEQINPLVAGIDNLIRSNGSDNWGITLGTKNHANHKKGLIWALRQVSGLAGARVVQHLAHLKTRAPSWNDSLGTTTLALAGARNDYISSTILALEHAHWDDGWTAEAKEEFNKGVRHYGTFNDTSALHALFEAAREGFEFDYLVDWLTNKGKDRFSELLEEFTHNPSNNEDDRLKAYGLVRTVLDIELPEFLEIEVALAKSLNNKTIQIEGLTKLLETCPQDERATLINKLGELDPRSAANMAHAFGFTAQEEHFIDKYLEQHVVSDPLKATRTLEELCNLYNIPESRTRYLAAKCMEAGLAKKTSTTRTYETQLAPALFEDLFSSTVSHDTQMQILINAAKLETESKKTLNYLKRACELVKEHSILNSYAHKLFPLLSESGLYKQALAVVDEGVSRYESQKLARKLELGALSGMKSSESASGKEATIREAGRLYDILKDTSDHKRKAAGYLFVQKILRSAHVQDIDAAFDCLASFTVYKYDQNL